MTNAGLHKLCFVVFLQIVELVIFFFQIHMPLDDTTLGLFLIVAKSVSFMFNIDYSYVVKSDF